MGFCFNERRKMLWLSDFLRLNLEFDKMSFFLL